ncbi:putative glycolipid-binding domain-containing protein [Paenibacillus sp. FSL H8-0457]|uniref:putative glycolipid-binding domain-containing protein n=1 Tax=unclassified Paenibacillus TaxID=185978 RepID=UPI0003E1D964|nr:putative glycolipid-binding domain-containing protein [Paenibacillus sp. FSL H8-457]ETT57163.1 hypothetical protein C172_29708 [Paenibacillus sp. FSL H8-457]
MNNNMHAEQDLQSIGPKNASSGQSGQLLQSLLWNRHDLPSLEHGRLYRHDDGFTLTGTVVASLEGRTLHCSYEVETTSSWETRKVRITLSSGTEEQSLHLERDDEGCWWNGDTELTALSQRTRTYEAGLAEPRPSPRCQCSPCCGSISRETVIMSPDPQQGIHPPYGRPPCQKIPCRVCSKDLAGDFRAPYQCGTKTSCSTNSTAKIYISG